MEKLISSLGNWFDQKIRGLSHLRGSVLVLVPSLYVLGFVTWSFHAAYYQLGRLPLADAQYFVTSIPSAAIIIVGLLAIDLLRAVRIKVKLWLAGPRRGWARRIAKWGLPVYFAGMLFGWGVLYLKSDPFSVLIGMAVLPFLPMIENTDPEERTMQELSVLYTYLVPLIFVIICLAIYVQVLFPIIPQEMGGAQPRCAQLEIRPELLSTSLQAELFSTAYQTNGADMTQSVPVLVIFDTADYLLLRALPQAAGGPLGALLRVPMGDVHTIRWCDS